MGRRLDRAGKRLWRCGLNGVLCAAFCLCRLALFLKLLPRIGSEVVVTRHRVSVDGRRDMRVRVAEALADIGQRDACRQQVRAVRVTQRMEAGAFGSLRSRNSSDTAAETASGFKGEPSGLQKM
jgi:hypothetical protein